ncbi:MAG: ComEC family competence protein [Candidatus Saccharibacteria bacterium]|nr:ComEC family competence protein [Candidatus Saccharibacteria bacterium]
MNFIVKSIRRFPYLFLTIFFAFGIVIEYNLNLGDVNVIGGAVFFVASLVSFVVYIKNPIITKTMSSLTTISASMLLMTVFFLGGVCEHSVHPKFVETRDLRVLDKNPTDVYVAKITSVPKLTKSGGINAEAEVFTYDVKMSTSTLTSALLTFDTCDVAFQKGDFVAFSASLKSTENDETIGFNYDDYLRKKGVEATAMVKRYEVLGQPQGIAIGQPQGIAPTDFSLETSASKLNDDLKNAIAKVDVNSVEVSEEEKDARDLIVAITLGNKTEMDDGLKNAYSKAGASHLLAVSGLHVGIIILIVESLVGLAISPKKRPFLFATVLLAIIWGYAFLTGLAASVVRTSLMYSVYRVALLLFSKPCPINVVSFTAFSMLVYNPFNIFDLGFQLSFSAVYSILLFGQPVTKTIENLIPEIKMPCREGARHVLNEKNEVSRKDARSCVSTSVSQVISLLNKLRGYVIGSVAISIAAQILTTPIILSIFHTIPILSIASSLITIPLVTLLIPLSFVYYGLYGLSTLQPALTVVSDFVLYVATLVARAVNAIVYYTADFSFATVDRLAFYSYDVAAWIVIFLLLAAYYNYRRLSLLWIAATLSVFYVAFAAVDGTEIKKRSMLAVYNVNGVTAVNRMTESNTLFGCGDTVKVAKKANDFWTNGLLPSPSSTDKRYFEFGDKRVYILSDKDDLKRNVESPLSVDVLILADNVATKVAELKNFRFRKLIVDGSNKYYVAKKWEEERKKSGVECHIVRFDGSWIEIIN